jgi:hypothetical protein
MRPPDEQVRFRFLRILDERGFIHQGSDVEGLDARAKSAR